ncbi:hypothetical protein ACFLQW_02695 [Candidatus Zixiibacteriota bacterium]
MYNRRENGVVPEGDSDERMLEYPLRLSLLSFVRVLALCIVTLLCGRSSVWSQQQFPKQVLLRYRFEAGDLLRYQIHSEDKLTKALRRGGAGR